MEFEKFSTTKGIFELFKFLAKFTFSYREKAKEMAHILSSKPVPAEELFIKNVEFATKFDLHEHLDMHGRHLSTVQYYNIDIWLCVFATVSTALYIFYRFIKLIVWCVVGRRRKTKTE